MPGLSLEAWPGDNIDRVAASAQDIADKLDRSVGFTFNSVRCVAMPGGNAEKLAEMQQEAQNGELVVYSNSAKVEFELRRGK